MKQRRNTHCLLLLNAYRYSEQPARCDFWCHIKHQFILLSTAGNLLSFLTGCRSFCIKSEYTRIGASRDSHRRGFSTVGHDASTTRNLALCWHWSPTDLGHGAICKREGTSIHRDSIALMPGKCYELFGAIHAEGNSTCPVVVDLMPVHKKCSEADASVREFQALFDLGILIVIAGEASRPALLQAA